MRCLKVICSLFVVIICACNQPVQEKKICVASADDAYSSFIKNYNSGSYLVEHDDSSQLNYADVNRVLYSVLDKRPKLKFIPEQRNGSFPRFNMGNWECFYTKIEFPDGRDTIKAFAFAKVDSCYKLVQMQNVNY
jgi:hypothetical protein